MSTDIQTPALPAAHEFSADKPAPLASIATVPVSQQPALKRLLSLDAYRGLVMVLMVSAGLGIPEVVRNFSRTPGLEHLKTPLWEKLAYQTDHSTWVGCSLWDLIQPSFMFMVGAALAFSLASRRAKGHSFWRMLGHAVMRSIILVALAILLTSNWSRKTEWVFTNVLAQIGLGYTFLFLIAWLKPRWQLTIAVLILVGYWAAFALYPKPAADFNLDKAHLPANWQRLTGFASHWEKNTNLGARADYKFLNLFPQASGKKFEFNAGGYETLNFVPSLATMIFGLLAGGLIRSRLPSAGKFGILIAAGIAGLAIGWALGWLGICPVVKRIWTPSWTIFSAGWAFLLLGVFYLIIDVVRFRAWAYPLVWVGMNSIAAYCMSQLLRSWIRATVGRHFPHAYGMFGDAYIPMVDTTLFLLLVWLTCWWMYRKKIFIRI